MDPQIISTSVAVAFIGILLFGFLWGLIRGFNKSTTRLLIVACCLVLTFFIVPSISKSVMSANIASFNITIGDSEQVATTFPEAVKLVIESFLPEDYASIASYKSFEVILTVLPQMIINILLFIVVFYALRLISMIIYWIIAGICFNKKKTAGKSRHRLLGSLIGVVQNFIIFLVLLVPVVGIMNMVGKAESVITTQSQQTNNNQSADAASINYYAYAAENTMDSENPGETTEGESSTSGANDTLVMVNDVINAYKDTWVYKMLNAVKLNDACNLVFDQLTTVKYEGQKYTLSKEVDSLINTYSAFKDIQESGALKDIASEEGIASIQTLINKLYEGKFTALVADELIKDAASQLSNPEDGEFLGFKLPADMQYRDVIVEILSDLAQSNNIHKQLIAATSTLKVIVKNKDLFSTTEGESFTADKIGTLLEELAENKDVFELVGDVVVKTIDTILPDAKPGEETNEYVGVIKETIKTIFTADYEDAKDEIPVISSTISLVQKINDANKEPAEGEEPVTFTKEDAKPVIEALTKSEVIYNVLVSGEKKSEIAKVIQKLPSEELSKVQAAITDIADSKNINLEGDNLTPEATKLVELQKLFTANTAE